MTKKQLTAALDAAEPRSWVIILPSFVWTGPSSFVKQDDGKWDDPDTLAHLWQAHQAGAVAITGVGQPRTTSRWLW